MNCQPDPILAEITEQHPYTMEALRGIAEDLHIPYVFLLSEICDILRFTRQAEAGAGE